MFSFKEGGTRGKSTYRVQDIVIDTGTDSKRRKVHVRYSNNKNAEDESELNANGSSDEDQFQPDVNVRDDGNACAGASNNLNEDTSYKVRRQRLVTNWAKIRTDLVAVYVESEPIPARAVCCDCEQPAVLRCRDCGPSVFYCQECCNSFHKWRNIFHMTEIWKVSMTYYFSKSPLLF